MDVQHSPNASLDGNGATKRMREALTSDRLNLGCGRFAKAGYINIDQFDMPGVDVVHDLSTFPYPFEDESFARVEADHVIEHLPDVFATMAEIHRLLMPGGVLQMRVPHFSRGFTHPDHKRGFDATFPYYFDPTFQGGYTGTHFVVEKTQMRWFAQPYLKRSVMPERLVQAGELAGKAIDSLANLNPLVCSRAWCYFVGGFEEIEFVLRKPSGVVE